MSQVHAIIEEMDRGELAGIKLNERGSRLAQILYEGVDPAVWVGHVVIGNRDPFCGLASSGLKWSDLSRQVFCFSEDAPNLQYVSLSNLLEIRN